MSIPTVAEKLAALKVTTASDYERACADALPRGAYEIAVQRTADILDEGYEIFMRSSRSSMGVAGDSIVAMFNAAGDLVNASAGTYLHAVIPPIVIKYIIAKYSDNPGIEDGDIFYTNDALYGGIHNPDQVAITPVFFDGKLVAWTAALSHTTETGAKEPGGMPVSATSRFEEGMNLPPMKIGRDFRINNDIIELFRAFGIRAEANVTVDLKARCTTADRVRLRIVEMCKREGVDFVTGLFRRMLDEAEAGARKRLTSWPDGTYRCVTFSDAAGNLRGLIRNCCMTVTKRGDGMVIDFTGTSPENLSSYNAHPQAVVGHLANYIYEYVFHDLPISSATFAPIDFVFPEASCLSPTARAATSNAVMICSGAMSAVANCISRARFPTYEWQQATASMGNGGNATVIAGLSQWQQPFADMIAYPINTEGQGARSCCDGMDAYGFPWCAFGRAPDVESIENEFPMIIPFSQHWPDSGGHGRFRGGCGTAQFWAAHHVPALYFMAIADNSTIQTPQPIFGGYAPPTVPGLSLKGTRVSELFGHLDNDTLDFQSLVEGRFGELATEPFGRVTRPINGDETVTIGLSTGGAGFGDPLERDYDSIERDLVKGLCSAWSAEHVYHVVWDAERRRIDREASDAARHEARRARIARGRAFDAFEAEWSTRKPPEDILGLYGSWPDAQPLAPAFRP
ncbi:MAG: hydantoinase B/oxoprolinase family protein [Gammaproteobacteria bacterium]|nr:hydantoinase B/oxoprolinase family protein [Gammaproteobacteria bacterium]MCP5200138.1 hydantoinase B/oxoprolinase family protein [Gammaproteobacteria bacterium]